ncbi:MAG TPA: DUF6702 family protein [Ohtaekwangia sp.]|nr:DUF6702 family protein [Ohtaekwangia sp.]
MKFLMVILFAALGVHPLHISVTEIEFDEKEKSLEIMMRVFIDDLETTMRQRTGDQELDILQPKGGQTLDQLMSAYLNERFRISLDAKAQKAGYLGHERDGDAFIFYIEVTNVKKWSTIQVQNDIITEVYDDQSNLVHVTARGTIRSMRLTKNTPADKLTFDSK